MSPALYGMQIIQVTGYAYLLLHAILYYKKLIFKLTSKYYYIFLKASCSPWIKHHRTDFFLSKMLDSSTLSKGHYHGEFTAFLVKKVLKL